MSARETGPRSPLVKTHHRTVAVATAVATVAPRRPKKVGERSFPHDRDRQGDGDRGDPPNR